MGYSLTHLSVCRQQCAALEALLVGLREENARLAERCDVLEPGARNYNPMRFRAEKAESSLIDLRSRLTELVEWLGSNERETFRHRHKDDGVRYTPFRFAASKLKALLLEPLERQPQEQG